MRSDQQPMSPATCTRQWPDPEDASSRAQLVSGCSPPEARGVMPLQTTDLGKLGVCVVALTAHGNWTEISAPFSRGPLSSRKQPAITPTLSRIRTHKTTANIPIPHCPQPSILANATPLPPGHRLTANSMGTAPDSPTPNVPLHAIHSEGPWPPAAQPSAPGQQHCLPPSTLPSPACTAGELLVAPRGPEWE